MAWCGIIVQIDRSHSANRHSQFNWLIGAIELVDAMDTVVEIL